MADVALTPTSSLTAQRAVPTSSLGTISARVFAWFMVSSALVYSFNLYLTYGLGWASVLELWEGRTDSPLAWVQLASYVLCLALPAAYVLSTRDRPLRAENRTITSIVTFLLRFAFWAVVLVGIVDFVISFLRVEQLLATLVGPQLAVDLGRSAYRGVVVHMPLIGLALVLAVVTRGLGFIWLGLLIVVAELVIVFTRFVFFYEQAFQADLVRFWHAALFLFASAYTLTEEGHVRVDVFYAGLRQETKGVINFIGTILLGLFFCWVVLWLGTWTRSATIVGPFMSFEVTQSAFGLYVKYWMAMFLGLFLVTMIIQFAGYMLEALADWRGDPGHVDHVDSMH
ncbi:MAG: TRAP transporter small permease subunit [Hyphomicrobiaceae bacterium]